MKVLRPCLALLLVASAEGTEESDVLTLENVPYSKIIVADEPIRASFSPKQAARYLDNASLNWQKQRNCVTCHTNMPYLMARPALGDVLPDSGEVRTFFEDYYLTRWEKGNKQPEKPYRPVVIGAALAFNDAQTTGALADVSRKTLDLMWTTQRENGAWDWAKCGWAPMEIDDHYGVTLAVLAAGIAPGGYAQTEPAQAGLEKARKYLKIHPAPSLHHRIMVAWASLRIEGLMDNKEREAVLETMLLKQLANGGWSTPSFLADWKSYERKDGKPHDVNSSDAYGTGLALVVAREMGVPATDCRLQKGVTWLKSNQRESGKWFSRSPVKDSKHYFTNTGCAFALLGLQACGALPGWPFDATKR